MASFIKRNISVPSYLRNAAVFLLLSLAIVSCQDPMPTIQSGETRESPGRITTSAPDHQSNRYIVTFDRQQITGREAGDLVSELAASHGFRPNFTYRHTIAGFAAVLSDRQLENLRADNRVERITPDIRISLYPEPSHHRDGHGGGPPDNGDGGDDSGSSQVTPWGISRVGGPLVQSSNQAWVIDTGIDLDHADLNVNVADGKNCVERGKDTMDDGNGHGTHVAGTIAATDNNIGVVGVTQNTQVVPVRVLDNSGSGFLSWIACGIDHVAANFSNGDVANLSLGAQSETTVLDDAVLSAASEGLLFSIAAGNSGIDAEQFTPARTGDDHPNVYTIAAIDESDAFPSWSNFGSPVSFAAPGVGILSTKRNSGTTEKSGTSMSAPHVAGLLLHGQLCSDGTATGTDGNQYSIAYRCDSDDLLNP